MSFFLELSFVIYFDLLNMKLPQSHELGHGIGRLTRIDSSHANLRSKIINQ
jgi:hypothetical protein